MGCNCKNKKGFSDEQVVNDTDNNTPIETTAAKVTKYSLKFLGFLVVLAFLPLINLVIIWMIFNTLVLTKEVDLKPMISFIGRKLKDTPKDEDDYEGEDLTDTNEEDLIMLDVEELDVYDVTSK